MSNPTHILYLDDSGNKDYSPDMKYATSGGRTPYFVFAGLLVTPAEAGEINVWMRKLKLNAFKNPNVEIKAHWLRFPEKRREKYLDPFNITDTQLTAYTDDVYAKLATCHAEFIACVVDKKAVQEKYGVRAYYAPAIAYECILQRANHAMEGCSGLAHVTIDDMEGKSQKGRAWKLNLCAQHKRLRRWGSRLWPGLRFDRIAGEEPAFKDSAKDERVQLSDLIAYAVYRQFVDYGADWDDPKKPLPIYDYLGRITERFRQHEGQISGFGIVRFPRGNVKWIVTEKKNRDGKPQVGS